MRRLPGRNWRCWSALSILGLASFIVGSAQADPPPPRSTSTVGMPAKIEQLVLPGPELEVKPLEDRQAPVVVRITGVYPHGTAFRYDLVYYAIEPGNYDLKNSLRRKDGSAMGDLPAIPVRVDPVLPPGQIEPNALALARSPSLGGYRLLLAFASSLWCAGLAAILLLGRHKKTRAGTEASRPVTLADRLRPLIDAALAGTLNEGQHAELERLLIGYWRTRLKLEHISPAEAITLMRQHEEAGALLRNLEEWLHKPGARAEAAEIAALFRPYQDLKPRNPDDETAPEPVRPSLTQLPEHLA